MYKLLAILLGFIAIAAASPAFAAGVVPVPSEVRDKAVNLTAHPMKTEYQYIMKAYWDLDEVVVLENDGENVAFEVRKEGEPYIQMKDGTRTWPRQEGKLVEIDGRPTVEKTVVTSMRFWQKGDTTLAEWAFDAGPVNKYLWTDDAKKEILYHMMGDGQLKINNIIENTHRRPYSVLPFIPSIHVKTLTAGKMKEEQVTEQGQGKFLYTARDGESTIEFKETGLASPIAITRVAGPLSDGGISETLYEGEQDFEGFLMPTAVETNKYDKELHKSISNRASNIRITRITDEEFAEIEEEYRSITKQ